MTAVAALLPALQAASRSVDGVLGLRDEVADDAAFIETLYADTRRDELAPLPWPDSAKRDFLAGQCRLQRDHYRQHYLGAQFLIIVRDALPIGRLYVHATAHEIRIMDIALLHEIHGNGIGSALVIAVQTQARQRGIPVTLHVEPANPAQRLYARLGFALIENRGVYDFLGWSPPGTATPQPAAS